jgi:hypothetical protein
MYQNRQPPPQQQGQYPGSQSGQSSPARDAFATEDATRVVTVNVGGQRFTTQLGTLRTHRSSVLAALFTPPYALHQDPADGSFFLDRNGEVFGLIVDYLRTGALVVPRDPVLYAVLRREVGFYGLPIAAQLPPSQPLSWEPAPVRYRHARVTIDEVEKTVEWEEGALPADLHTRQTFEIVNFFAARGYQVASEYTSRGSRGYASIWLTKRENYPGADVGIEVSAADVPYAAKRRMDLEPGPYAGPPAAGVRSAFDSVANGRSATATPPTGRAPSPPGQTSGGGGGGGGPWNGSKSASPPPQGGHYPSQGPPHPGQRGGPSPPGQPGQGQQPFNNQGPSGGGGGYYNDPNAQQGGYQQGQPPASQPQPGFATTSNARSPGTGSTQFGGKLPLKLPPGGKMPLVRPLQPPPQQPQSPPGGSGGSAGSGPSMTSPPNPWN